MTPLCFSRGWKRDTIISNRLIQTIPSNLPIEAMPTAFFESNKLSDKKFCAGGYCVNTDALGGKVRGEERETERDR